MEKVKKIVKWIIYSSANKANISLTLKAIVPFLVFLNLGNHMELEQVSDYVAEAFFRIGEILSLMVAVYGLGRKIFLTIKK
jgi:hypothetical protein